MKSPRNIKRDKADSTHLLHLDFLYTVLSFLPSRAPTVSIQYPSDQNPPLYNGFLLSAIV